MTEPRYGATLEAWKWFAQNQGLTGDLLPVVSNTNAKINKDSTLSSLGKTPSKFNQVGEVVGIGGWTKRISSGADVSRWAREPDYGICIQCREVRALDVDVTDPALAKAIAAEIDLFLMMRLPMRLRSNSSKFLLAFRLPGEFPKSVLKVGDKQMIEFLANGRQFIAAGQHPSGAMYEWRDGLPDFPTIAESDLRELMAHLEKQFGTEPWREDGAGRAGAGVEDGDPDEDEVARFMDENGITVQHDKRSGARYLTCPFADEHEGGVQGTITSTAYFPSKTGGYARGHFKCLHAHCGHRTDHEYLDAIGYLTSHFDDLTKIRTTEVEKRMPVITQRDKSGRIEAVIEQVTEAARCPDFTGRQLAYDVFRDALCISEDGEWRDIRDPDITELRILLAARGFKPVSKEMMRDAVALVAHENSFDSAQQWLESLKWDGIPRISKFYPHYFGVTDEPYSRAVGLYTWSAMAGRVLSPGVKADMVPILEGEQGIRKSTVVEAMCPTKESFVELGFKDKEDDMSRKMRGALVAEIAELDGLHTREIETIKKFITRTHEKWIPKFQEFSTTFPRRLIFIGTTNKTDLLADETGNRRWLPMHVRRADADAVARDRDQLWAEGAAVFKERGVCWQGMDDLSKKAHEAYQTIDVWEDAIDHWLDAESTFDPDGRKNGEGLVTIMQILTEALGLRVGETGELARKRVCRILRKRNFLQKVVRNGGKTMRGWGR